MTPGDAMRFTWIGRGVSALLLAAQLGGPVSEQLERERLAAGNGSYRALLTIIAVHEDGTPVRGYIRCSGWWIKYEDDPARTFAGEALPFKTDSRGAIVMNPHLDDEDMYCWSTDKGKHGVVHIYFAHDPVGIHRIVLNKKAGEDDE